MSGTVLAFRSVGYEALVTRDEKEVAFERTNYGDARIIVAPLEQEGDRLIRTLTQQPNKWPTILVEDLPSD